MAEEQRYSFSVNKWQDVNKVTTDHKYDIVVVITESGGSYSSSKTLSQIQSAISSGGNVKFQSPMNSEGTLLGNDAGNSVMFYCIDDSDGGAPIQLSVYTITSSSVTVTRHAILNSSVIPSVETVTGATLTIAAADNHIYSCGELTSLTITDSAQNISFKVDFTSGSTATVINTPSGYKAPGGDLTAEANKEYELDVRNGKAVLTAFEAVSASA